MKPDLPKADPQQFNYECNGHRHNLHADATLRDQFAMAAEMTSRLDAMIRLECAMREKRLSDLNEALLDPDALSQLIMHDAANAVASIGGYSAPFAGEAREKWILDHMHN